MKNKASGYLQLSKTEIRAAEYLYNAGGEFDAQAMYLVSQSTEKAVRALAEEASVLIGTTHSFDKMASLFPADHPFKERIADYDEVLSSASTRMRYVTEKGTINTPQKDTISEAIEEARNFLKDVRAYLLGNDLRPTLKR